MGRARLGMTSRGEACNLEEEPFVDASLPPCPHLASLCTEENPPFMEAPYVEEAHSLEKKSFVEAQ